MIVITYAYTPETEGMRQMRLSVERQGYELAVVKTTDYPATIMRDLYECYKRAATGHEYMVYADYPDTFFQKKVEVPTDHILYSTEKACFPFPQWATHFERQGRWIYPNNGLFAGPLKLVIEFFERYKLYDIGAVNGQAAMQQAYLKARDEWFPVLLDTDCEVFQSIAFEDPDEFEMKDGLLHNKITGTVPAIIHGNGLTDMSRMYKTVKH